jgi:hypothetical protein
VGIRLLCKTQAAPGFPLHRLGQLPHLEHVPEKLTDFSDQNMLQAIDLERILVDRVTLPDRNTL